MIVCSAGWGWPHASHSPSQPMAPTQPMGSHVAPVPWQGPCDTHARWERTPQVAASLLWANLGKDRLSTQEALARLAPRKTPPAPLPHQVVNPCYACFTLQHLGERMCRDPKGSYSHPVSPQWACPVIPCSLWVQVLG